MKKHEESKDLRSFARIGRVNVGEKKLIANKTAIIGIKMWGKIDYLTHYCGYTFLWDNVINGFTYTTAVFPKNTEVSKTDVKKVKKEYRANKRSNKNKHE